ncbi:MAG: metal-dependent hydrolase [Candidatus Hodarchaeales archaeon]
MIPDVDAQDSKFFHDYPEVSKFFKYAIYHPIGYILNGKKHRGVMHTIEGGIVATIMFLGYITIFLLIGGIIGLFVLPSMVDSLISSWNSIEKVPIDIVYVLQAYLLVGMGLFLGIIMHIYEDSLTVSGINWKWSGESPWYRKGNLRVGGQNETLVSGIIMGGPGIILLLQYVNEDLFMAIILSIATPIWIIGIGKFSQSNLFITLFKIDILERDVTTRNKAVKESYPLELTNKININIEKGRIKRGLAIDQKEIDLEGLTVGKYKIIKTTKTGAMSLSCTCKDYKNTGDVVSCKHIIAYLAFWRKTYRTKLENEIR